MRFWILIAVAMLTACGNGDSPPPEPPPSTTTTSVEPPIPPPPADCALPDVGRGEPSCYITRERAGERNVDHPGRSTGLIGEMMTTDSALVNTARNFRAAADRCPEAVELPPFDTSASELRGLSDAAFIYHDGGREINVTDTVGNPSMIYFVGEGELHRGQLERPHRHCSTLGPPWCGRTNVFQPFLAGFREEVADHLERMGEIDGRSPVHDGICHWLRDQGCSCR